MIIMCEIVLDRGDYIRLAVAWLTWEWGMFVCVCTLGHVWDSLCRTPLVPVHSLPIEPTIQL